jgi:hypothetical protein
MGLRNKCQLKTSLPTVAPVDRLAIKNTIFWLICQAIRLQIFILSIFSEI